MASSAASLRLASSSARLRPLNSSATARSAGEPPAADLPEGIPESVLKAEYGGIGGAGYRALFFSHQAAHCWASWP